MACYRLYVHVHIESFQCLIPLFQISSPNHLKHPQTASVVKNITALNDYLCRMRWKCGEPQAQESVVKQVVSVFSLKKVKKKKA